MSEYTLTCTYSWQNRVQQSGGILSCWYGLKSLDTGQIYQLHPNTDFIFRTYVWDKAYNTHLNTLRPRWNEQHFADDIFKRIFCNENVWISIKISLKFVTKGPINDIPALVQMMAWRRSGNKPLSKPMMVSLPTHICATRSQWVNDLLYCKTKFCFSLIAFHPEQIGTHSIQRITFWL